MALTRWSLDKLVAWIGSAALTVLFVPTTLWFALSVSLSAERALIERGQSLGTALAGQVVDALLLEDHLALDDALRKATLADSEIRYICVEGTRGEVVGHTFASGYPVGLADLWRESGGQPAKFRTAQGPLVDVPTAILDGQLGTVHIGLSRAALLRSAQSTMWVMGAALLGGLTIVFAGAQLLAARVSLPLRRLEERISRYPEEQSADCCEDVLGTREVESLARGLADMTKRLGALERERAATQEQMVHAERLAALGELAAGLAHEVHNPLDGMQECMRYLDADPNKGERAAKYYPMLQSGLGRIAAVMRGILTFAHSGQKVSLEPCLLRDVFDSLRLLTEVHLSDRHVRLTWQDPGECVCLCDRVGLEQAALNLILNAAEAAKESARPQVRIEGKCDAQWAYLVTEDSGPGVPERLREQVFVPFFTTKPAGKGTGLGLSVSRQLMRAAGGDITLAPEAGSLGGSRFTIRLRKASRTECENA
jgi:signal transduction histidine kinase